MCTVLIITLFNSYNYYVGLPSLQMRLQAVDGKVGLTEYTSGQALNLAGHHMGFVFGSIGRNHLSIQLSVLSCSESWMKWGHTRERPGPTRVVAGLDGGCYQGRNICLHVSRKTKPSYHSYMPWGWPPTVGVHHGNEKPFLHSKYHKKSYCRDQDKKAKPLGHTLAPWVVWFSGAIFPKDGGKGLPWGGQC